MGMSNASWVAVNRVVECALKDYANGVDVEFPDGFIENLADIIADHISANFKVTSR